MAASSFVAVDESYCVPQQVQLVVQEKLLWYSRDDFTIVEARSKKPWFKLRRTAFRGPRRTKKFLGAQGNVLARVKEHPVAVPRQLFVQGSGFSFEVVRRMSLKGSEAVAVVHNLSNRTKHRIHAYSNSKHRSLELYSGRRDEGGRLLAAADRAVSSRGLLTGSHRYVLTVEPYVDVALCVLMLLFCDELNCESEH